jgi:hypothetical protein
LKAASHAQFAEQFRKRFRGKEKCTPEEKKKKKKNYRKPGTFADLWGVVTEAAPERG